VGDIDGDGDADVLANERSIGRLHWWENVDGVGSAWIQHLVDDGRSGPNDALVADVDGDLVADMVASHAFEHAICWYGLASDYAPSGRLKSSILTTGDPATAWGTLDWTSTEPTGTSVWMEVRASNDTGDLGTWVPVLTSGEDLTTYIGDDAQYFQYRVNLETTDGGVTPTVAEVTVHWQPVTGVEECAAAGQWFLAATPRPNPSRDGAAVIRFALPQACPIELALFDVSGRRLRTLAEGSWPRGEHRVTVSGLPAGAYFYRLTAPAYQSAGKMIVSRP
jgi:hypothetical protein